MPQHVVDFKRLCADLRERGLVPIHATGQALIGQWCETMGQPREAVPLEIKRPVERRPFLFGHGRALPAARDG